MFKSTSMIEDFFHRFKFNYFNLMKMKLNDETKILQRKIKIIMKRRLRLFDKEKYDNICYDTKNMNRNIMNENQNQFATFT